jgi:hypothetical protein
LVPAIPVSFRLETVAIPPETDSSSAPESVRALRSSDTAVIVSGCDEETPVVTRLASASWISTTTPDSKVRSLAAVVAPVRTTAVAAP